MISYDTVLHALKNAHAANPLMHELQQELLADRLRRVGAEPSSWPADVAAGIYTGRLQSAKSAGIRTWGVEDVITMLKAHGSRPVALFHYTSRDHTYTLIVDGETDYLLGCLKKELRDGSTCD